VSVQISTCVWVECDGQHCGRDKGWPDEGPYHFAREQSALEYVLGEAGIGWTKMPDGRLLCRSCSEDADCDTTGHQWTDWRPGYNNGHPDPTIEVRFCTHCGGGFEERLAEMGDTQ
jgi:hypothetical protein